MKAAPLEKLRSKFLSFLGICGCLSCYFGHFPLVVAGLVGFAGISTFGIVAGLNVYAISPFFTPILVVSIILLVLSMIRDGRAAVILSLIGGLAIFISMNYYLSAWLFLLALLLFGAAKIAGTIKTKGTVNMRAIIVSALPFVMVAFILGIATFFIKPPQDSGAAEQQSPAMMQMEP